MSSITARTLINDALGNIGVLDATETASAEQAQHGLRTLNRIIDSYNAKRLAIYAVKEVVTSFAGASAAIGTGLTIDTDTPLRLMNGNYYVRSGISYPLPLWSREAYNAVILKATPGEYPSGIYYDRQIPGTVYVWPVPSVAPQYHLQVMAKMSSFVDLDTAYKFPDGYQDLLFYTLCERLPAAYNFPVNPADSAEATRARLAVGKNNTNVPILDTIQGVGSRWNIYSNQFQ